MAENLGLRKDWEKQDKEASEHHNGEEVGFIIFVFGVIYSSGVECCCGVILIVYPHGAN